MNFVNYLKISFSNWDKMWKLALFRIVVWCFVLALIAPFYSAIKDVILSSWNFELFKEFAGAGLFFGKNVTLTFAVVAETLIGALGMLFTKYLAAGIYISIILFIVRPFLMNIGRYVVSEMMYGYMSSHAKHGFMPSLIRTLKNSLSYAALRMLFCLPFNVLAAGIFYCLLLVPGEGFAIAMPFIFLTSFTILASIKQLLIMGWAPAMVVSGENVANSFGGGIAATFRGFGKSALFAVCVYFALTLLAFGFGVFSLLIIVPLCAIITSSFEMMNYFSCQGMRYYTNKDTVLSSKKLEEQDRITKAKFLL